MERIKKALEVARAEREHGFRAVQGANSIIRAMPTPAPGQPADSGSDAPNAASAARLRHPQSSEPQDSLTDTAVLFARTTVAAVDERAIRANRLLRPGVVGEAAHSFKMLRTQVLQRLAQNNWNTLAVVSPTPDDGKTFTAINLAIAISGDTNFTALLVDLDLRRPSVHSRFGITPLAGIDRCLRGEADVSSALVNPQGYERLLVLPGGSPVQSSSELLSSERARRLFREIKERYRNRVVLFDLPPVLGADDALSFMPQVDAALVVVREGKTESDDLLRLFEILKNVPVVGTVLNGARTDPARSYAY